jgi:hypothetical protein
MKAWASNAPAARSRRRRRKALSNICGTSLITRFESGMFASAAP